MPATDSSAEEVQDYTSAKEERNETLRERIRAIIAKKEFRQRDIATRARIEPGTLSAFMTGKSASMRRPAMQRLFHVVEALEHPYRVKLVDVAQESDGNVQDDGLTDNQPRAGECPELDSLRKELAQMLANGDPSFEDQLGNMRRDELLRVYCLARAK